MSSTGDIIATTYVTEHHGVRKTRSSAVAERPRNASFHWIFC